MSENESSQSERSQRSKKNGRRRKVLPLMDPLSKMKIKINRIVINLSMTHYDVITDVADSFQWTIQYKSNKGDWDVLWTDDMIEPDTLIKMHFFQKISHFPGIYVIARKNLLGLSLTEMKKKFPEDYNFFPKTWLLPTDFSDFRQEVENCEANNQNKCYIVKPEAECQGRGIFLTFRTDQVENGKHYVVQEYLGHPFLIDGLKFDFRVYVLLCGTNPMRLYVYEEGLARLATQKYQQPSKHNIKKMCMHLTNYAINKKNPKYIFNNSVHSMNIGHKRSLTSVYKNIEKKGGSVEQFKNKLDDVIIKTMILGQPLISHQYKFAQPDDEYRNMCFHILGIDVMINESLEPFILEVNHTPSFATDTPLDYFIKFNLIKDTLILMNIGEESKKKLVEKTKCYQRERIITGKKLMESEEQRQKIKWAQIQRDLYENTHRGKYRKIYPKESQSQMQKYNEFLKYAQKIYFSENNVIRAQIENERDKERYERKDKDSRDRQSKDREREYKDKDHEKNMKEKDKQKFREKKKEKEKQKQKTMSSICSIKSFEKLGEPNFSYPARSNNSACRKNLCQSQKLIEQAQEKYPSTQFFLKQEHNIRVSSVFRNNLNLNPFCCNFSYTNRLKHLGASGAVKASKKINYYDFDDEKQLYNRLKYPKNLPKIQKSGKKSSTVELKKSKYVSAHKMKFREMKDEKLRQIVKEKGTFLIPKNLKFGKVQQELLTHDQD